MMLATLSNRNTPFTPKPRPILQEIPADPALPDCELRFVTDGEGRIVDYDRQRIDDWLKARIDLEGMDLRRFLVSCRPHWEFRLAREPFDALPRSLLLPWLDHGDELPALEWRTLTYNGAFFVTLLPQGVPAQSNRLAGVCWSNLLDHFAGGSYRQRTDLSFLFVSGSLRAHLGLKAENGYATDGRFLDCIHPHDRQALASKLKTMESGRQDAVTWQYRFRNPLTKKLHFLTDVRMPMYDSDGSLTGYEGVLMDVTRQATMENTSTGTDWDQNLSLLISGMAHDFGNVISGLSILTETCNEGGTAQAFQKETADHIRDYSRQANHLIRRILDVSSARQCATRKDLHNFESLALEAVDFVSLIVGRRSRVHIQTDDTELPVHIDAPGFQQMVLNFAANARDAKNGGLEIWITARRCRREAFAHDPDASPKSDHEQWIEFTFEDNGVGVPDANLERIFDPFFTTKKATNGSGLGLYNARVFCEEQGGTISARRRDPHGLKIVARFPMLNEEQIIRHIKAGNSL